MVITNKTNPGGEEKNNKKNYTERYPGQTDSYNVMTHDELKIHILNPRNDHAKMVDIYRY